MLLSIHLLRSMQIFLARFVLTTRFIFVCHLVSGLKDSKPTIVYSVFWSPILRAKPIQSIHRPHNIPLFPSFLRFFLRKCDVPRFMTENLKPLKRAVISEVKRQRKHFHKEFTKRLCISSYFSYTERTKEAFAQNGLFPCPH